MSTVLLLDTHAWLWLVRGERRLAADTLEAVFEAAGRAQLYLSVMSIWEVALMERKGRLILENPCLRWVGEALSRSGAEPIPLSVEIAIESHNLPGPFHDDPADRIIAATARVEGMTLVTRDRQLLVYAEQGHLGALAC